ncbi:MAG: exonuclease SbcCD subunit [Chthonomonadaceae bacterium]|nr:exonuclease SbcCD subunit [Chthonomonadaceae bacterium]
MRILHTGDWHLGDRIGSCNPKRERHDDLGRALRQIANYLKEHEVDVMLVAGDVFSEYCTSNHERMNRAITQICDVFNPFLTGGGTIVAISGNHDNELLFDTLNQTLGLVCQTRPAPEGCMPTGRPYLFAPGPAIRKPLRLAGRDGQIVQIVPMPYPSIRFLTASSDGVDVTQQYRDKRTFYLTVLQNLCEQLDPHYPSILLSHLALEGVSMTHHRCMRADEDVLFTANDLRDRWYYIACGHIHKPTPMESTGLVRYCGSIDRLDAGEINDQKSVVLFDVKAGQPCQPILLPLESTPIYDLTFRDVDTELPRKIQELPDRERALVKYTLHYNAMTHNLNELRRHIEEAFPRWYASDFQDESKAELSSTEGFKPQDLHDVSTTVLTFLEGRLPAEGPEQDPDREALLVLARQLLTEEGFGSSQGQVGEAAVQMREAAELHTVAMAAGA